MSIAIAVGVWVVLGVLGVRHYSSQAYRDELRSRDPLIVLVLALVGIAFGPYLIVLGLGRRLIDALANYLRGDDRA